MSNYIEYNEQVAFHPGYYIKEIVDDSGLTQEDFAKRLDTTPKNLCVLIQGEQRLSIDIAFKLSRMLGTTVAYWLGLQQAFDERQAQFLMEEELKREREVFDYIDYKYFREYYGLPDLPRQIESQIKSVREFLSVASLTVLKNRNFSVRFRSYSNDLSQSNIINSNVMVQIAINKALESNCPKYNKQRFEKVVASASRLTTNHKSFLKELEKLFYDAGVVLVVLPNLKNSGVNGATKKVNGRVMLMVNDRNHYEDTFWFTLFHEIGHILNGDFGVSFNDEAEDDADLFARDTLIPKNEYELYISQNKDFDKAGIIRFAKSIGQDPAIVLGRLMYDKKVDYRNSAISRSLRRKFKID